MQRLSRARRQQWVKAHVTALVGARAFTHAHTVASPCAFSEAHTVIRMHTRTNTFYNL